MSAFHALRCLTVALLLAPLPATADALIDNVRGVTLDRDQRVVRFQGIVIDAQGKVVRLVPVGEQPPKPTKKNPGPRYDWRADMKGRVVLPGFIDAHGHVIEIGRAHV